MNSFISIKKDIDTLNFMFIDTKANLFVNITDLVQKVKWRLAVPKFNFTIINEKNFGFPNKNLLL